MTELREALRRHLKTEIAQGRARALVWAPGATPAPAPPSAAAAPDPGPALAARAVAARREAPVPAPPRTTPAARFAPDPGAPNTVPGWLEPRKAGQFAQTLENAMNCSRCGLAATRTRVVFGTGSGRNGVLFIGEAPGRDEDLTGEPFVGRAGQLLTKILAALGWSREEVYIANVLKCRPPENRDPEPEEVALCSPYLLRQIGLLEPRVLCALGNHAAQLLLNRRASMASLRGRVLDFQGIPLVASYHPAAILRNPNLKRPLWEDMQLLKRTHDALVARS